MAGSDQTDEARRKARDHLWLKRHLLAYAGIAAASLLVNAVTFAGQLWAIWPLMIFGTLAGVHYLYVRSVYVDEDWVDERAEDLRMKSYDFDHIRDIQRRYEERIDGPGSSPDERDERTR